MSLINIAIADDYKIFRDGLKVGLAKDDNFNVILEAENGEDLLIAFKSSLPDVVIMDLKMPIMDGMEATKLIRKLFGSTFASSRRWLSPTWTASFAWSGPVLARNANNFATRSAGVCGSKRPRRMRSWRRREWRRSGAPKL